MMLFDENYLQGFSHNLILDEGFKKLCTHCSLVCKFLSFFYLGCPVNYPSASSDKQNNLVDF